MPEPNYNGLKWIFLGLIAATFLCFMMGGVTLRQQIARLGRQSKDLPQEWKPSPFAKIPAAPKVYPSPQTNAPEPALNQPAVEQHHLDQPAAAWQPPPAQLLGRWQGGGATMTGFFFFTIEITTDTRNPAQLLGFAKMMSLALPTPRLGLRQPSVRELVEQRMPRQISLIGTSSGDGAVDFHVAKAIGPQGDCPITDIRISPWGTEGISAEWKGTACPGGSLVLARQP